jgi:hypothetical protein
MSEAVYTGEDIEVIIDLIDVNFAVMTDVIVGVVVNKVLVKTMKKTSSTEALKVLPVTDAPTKCMIRLFRSETKTWQPGMLNMEVTTVSNVSGFPSGKHTLYKENIILFANAQTKNA